MIVLDTNVLSEFIRPNGNAAVVSWAAAQSRNDLFIASPAMAELRFGVVRLAAGRRKSELIAKYDELRKAFRSNIAVFDLRAAEAFADILLSRQRSGSPIEVMDAQIAAIARSRSATVATRDIGGFSDCGVTLIDPWAYAG